MSLNLQQSLQTHFSYESFRPGQEEIVEAIMAGRDVVALMPTGGGKSLCYQLPALISGKTSLVISPLIALMKDQVDALKARGIKATYINSSLTPEEVRERMAAMKRGEYKLVYVAPERLSSPYFQRELGAIDFFLVAIDEAHCVSAWGHDFRPDYLLINQFIRVCAKRPVVAAFTATATPEVKHDIIERLELKNPAVFLRGFDRPNLRFFVRSGIPHKHRAEEALRIIRSVPGAAVVYTLSRKNAEELAEYLVTQGIKAAAYHAGMAAPERTRIQDDFMENRFQVIVATIAFGMGVDKSDVRLVLHAGVPASLESYYQEAGRAGRDGEVAYCVIVPSGKDISLHHYFIQKSMDEMGEQGKPWEEIQRIIDIKYSRLERMKNYLSSDACRRRKILEYFADPALAASPENCRSCDVCLNYTWKEAPRAETEESDILSRTVRESVGLYEQGHRVEQIAKIRGLGMSTIFGHLLKWHNHGGNFRIDEYITPADEELVLDALARADSAHPLGSAKAQLPDRISYEMIRMVMAKRGKGKE